MSGRRPSRRPTTPSSNRPSYRPPRQPNHMPPPQTHSTEGGGDAFIETIESHEAGNVHVVRLTLCYMDGIRETIVSRGRGYRSTRKDAVDKAHSIAHIIQNPSSTSHPQRNPVLPSHPVQSPVLRPSRRVHSGEDLSGSVAPQGGGYEGRPTPPNVSAQASGIRPAAQNAAGASANPVRTTGPPILRSRPIPPSTPQEYPAPSRRQEPGPSSSYRDDERRQGTRFRSGERRDDRRDGQGRGQSHSTERCDRDATRRSDPLRSNRNERDHRYSRDSRNIREFDNEPRRSSRSLPSPAPQDRRRSGRPMRYPSPLRRRSSGSDRSPPRDPRPYNSNSSSRSRTSYDRRRQVPGSGSSLYTSSSPTLTERKDREPESERPLKRCKGHSDRGGGLAGDAARAANAAPLSSEGHRNRDAGRSTVTQNRSGEEETGEKKPEKCSDAEQADVESEDEGTNYVSILNVLITRHRNMLPDLKATPERLPFSQWRWKMKVLRFSENEEMLKPLEVSATNSNKKLAKQMAAKLMLREIKNAYPNITSPTAPAKASRESNDSTSTEVINRLFNLFQKGILSAKPQFLHKEEKSDNALQWRMTCVVQPVGQQDISCCATDSTKRSAKQAAASLALKELRKRKIPGLEEAMAVRTPSTTKSPIMSIGELEDNTAEDVRMSDGEQDGFDDMQESFDDRFLLPSEYNVVYANSDEDADEWVKKNVAPGSNVGVYLDSEWAREDLQSVAEKDKFEMPAPTEEVDMRVMCLATECSAILLYASKFGTTTGNSSWIPSSVVRILTTRFAKKHTFMVDDAALTLMHKHGIEIVAANNIEINSFAIRGEAESEKCVILPMHRLTEKWLQKRFRPFCATAIESVPGLSAQMKVTEDFVCPAVLTAYAILRIAEEIKVEADAQRFDLLSSMPGFEELARRLIPGDEEAMNDE